MGTLFLFFLCGCAYFPKESKNYRSVDNIKGLKPITNIIKVYIEHEYNPSSNNDTIENIGKKTVIKALLTKSGLFKEVKEMSELIVKCDVDICMNLKFGVKGRGTFFFKGLHRSLSILSFGIIPFWSDNQVTLDTHVLQKQKKQINYIYEYNMVEWIHLLLLPIKIFSNKGDANKNVYEKLLMNLYFDISTLSKEENTILEEGR